MKRLVVTAGMGIGPEVALRALEGADDVVLVGRLDAIRRAATGQQLALVECVDQPVSSGLPVLDTTGADEAPEVAAIRLAVEACLEGRAEALVTGPIHKMRLAEQGFTFPGHTGFLGHLCGVPDPVMAFAGGSLRVALVTTHIPLRAVPDALSRSGVARVARIAAQSLQRDLGVAAPRIAVCGLNPHAGEEGLLGTEELDVIGPACDDLRAEGWHIVGPVSAETAFLEAREGRADLVVAMYHDQGLAPLKLVDFGRSVNWTMGLPILRTSVDHGTADALVGTGRADPSSMGAALSLARQIVRRRATL